MGTLYIVATPIGNREDITERARRVLSEVDLICAEDTRHTLPLLTSLGIKNRLLSLHEYSDDARINQVLDALDGGKDVALCSDAGTPLISDPGAALVARAHERGIRVTPVPGASAVMAAVCSCGLVSGEFTFIGFLPRTTGRDEKLNDVARSPRPCVLFESPKRLNATLAELADVMPGRKISVCRELTKVFEEITTDSVENVLAAYADREVKGEIVLVVEGERVAVEVSDEDILAAMNGYVEAGLRVKDAAEKTALMLGVAKNRVKKVYLAQN